MAGHTQPTRDRSRSRVYRAPRSGPWLCIRGLPEKAHSISAWVGSNVSARELCSIGGIRPGSCYSLITFRRDHERSGSNVVISVATRAVSGPRSFWYTSPSGPTINVMMPVELEHGRPSDQRKAAGHAARVKVALGAAISIWTLPFKNTEIIAFVRDRLAADQLARITRVACRIDQRPEWAFTLALAYGPIKAVMAPLRADQTCGIKSGSVSLLGAIEIIALSIDAGEQRADRRQLITTDPPVDDGLRPGVRIEGPAPAAFDERDRERPIIRADIELRTARAFRGYRVLLVVESDETSSSSRSAYRSPESMTRSPSGPRIARKPASLWSRKAATNAVTASSGDAKPRCCSGALASTACAMPSQTQLP